MTLFQRSETVRDFNGVVVSKATIRVVDGLTYSDTAPLSSIYADPDGLVPLSNPFQADAAGQYLYWVNLGYYSEQVSRPGYYSETNEGFFIGGLPGPAGPQGTKGDTGNQGAKGDPGEVTLALLADATDPAKGAGLTGFLSSLAYGAGTIGKFLKDLSTSLTAFVSNLAGTAGATLVGYLAPFTGAGPRTQHQKNAEFVSVLDFYANGVSGAMVDPTGSVDSILGIKAALAASQNVFFPPGKYKISAPIDWTNQWIIGAVNNGIYSSPSLTNQTTLLPTGNFAAIRYYSPSNAYLSGGGIKNLNIYFGAGTVPATPNAAVGIEISPPSGGWPAFCTFEHISVSGATWAIYDYSGSWMCKWKTIWSSNNYAGFYKKWGTTLILDNCCHDAGFGGFSLINVVGVTMNGCAVDSCSTAQSAAGYQPIYIENSTVVVNGMDMEECVLTGDYLILIRVTGASSLVTFNGIRIKATQIANTTTELYLVGVDTDSIANFNGIDFSTPAYTGSGGVIAFFIASVRAQISINGAVIPPLSSGTPTSVYAGVTPGGSIDFNNATTSHTWYACRRIEKSIRSTQSNTYGLVTTGSNSNIGFTVTGAALGDLVRVAPTTSVPTGVFFTGIVTSANTVNVVMYNLSGSSQTLGAISHNIVVTQQ